MVMKWISILGMFLVFCFSIPYSGEVMADNDNQAEAEKLLRAAGELTDIRATGSHAFRLVARVKVFDEKAQATEGTYSLVWKGPTDWQDKLRLGGFSQERTAVVDKLFFSRSTPAFTLEVSDLLKLLEFPNLLRFSLDAKAQKLRARMRNGSREREVELTLPGRSAWKTIFFDASSAAPTRVEYKGSHFGYRFENYVEFNGHQYPHTLTQFNSKMPLIQVQVQELIEVIHDTALLVPRQNANWFHWCPHPVPANPLDAGKVHPIPWPLRDDALKRPVTIYGFIGTDGIWHNLTVVKTAGEEVDSYWMDVMLQEHFSPARCGEAPVEQESVSEFYLP
jgi:hypothetical protein